MPCTTLQAANYAANLEYVSLYQHDIFQRFKSFIPNLQVLRANWIDDEEWIVLVHIATWLGFDHILEQLVEPRFRCSFSPQPHHLGCTAHDSITLCRPRRPSHPPTARAGRISRWALFAQPNHDLFWASAATLLLPSQPYAKVEQIYMAVMHALLGKTVPPPPHGMRATPNNVDGVDDAEQHGLLAGLPADVLHCHVLSRLTANDVRAAAGVCRSWRASVMAVVHHVWCAVGGSSDGGGCTEDTTACHGGCSTPTPACLRPGNHGQAGSAMTLTMVQELVDHMPLLDRLDISGHWVGSDGAHAVDGGVVDGGAQDGLGVVQVRKSTPTFSRIACLNVGKHVGDDLDALKAFPALQMLTIDLRNSHLTAPLPMLVSVIEAHLPLLEKLHTHIRSTTGVHHVLPSAKSSLSLQQRQIHNSKTIHRDVAPSGDQRQIHREHAQHGAIHREHAQHGDGHTHAGSGWHTHGGPSGDCRDTHAGGPRWQLLLHVEPPLTCQTLLGLGMYSNLHTLDLHVQDTAHQPPLDTPSLAAIAQLTSLVSLNLSGRTLPHVRPLSCLTGLQELFLNNVDFPGGGWRLHDMPGQLRKVLPQLSGLTRLELSSATTACLPTELASTLDCCTKLQHLDISGWPAWHDAVSSQLQLLTALTHLSAQMVTPVTHNVTQLTALQNLKALKMASMGCPSVQTMPAIQKLLWESLTALTKLTYLDLSGNAWVTSGLARDRTLAGLPRDAEWVWKAGPIFDWRLLAAHPLPHLRYLNLSYAASMEHYAGNDPEGFAEALRWLAGVDELVLPRTCTLTPLPTTTSDVGWSLRMAMNDVFGG